MSNTTIQNIGRPRKIEFKKFNSFKSFCGQKKPNDDEPESAGRIYKTPQMFAFKLITQSTQIRRPKNGLKSQNVIF
jgi:hypothetical protein